MFKLKSSTSHLLCAFAAAISGITLPVTVAQSTIDLADSVRDIDGFTAHRISDKYVQSIYVRQRQKFLKESGKLTQAISECRRGIVCDPHIKSFINMLDEASADPNPLHKIVIINAWVNLSVAFQKEGGDNLSHRPLLEIFTNGASCDGYSLLKLYALRHTGFGKTEAFWMGILEYQKPISFERLKGHAAGHAIAVAKIGTKFWALDFFTNPYRFSTKEAVIQDAGAVEELSSYVNYSGNSRYPDTVRYPAHILNDMSQYFLGTDEAKIHNNESMKRLPAFAHLPDGILSAPKTITVLARPEQFASLDTAYDLNVPSAPATPRTVLASARQLAHGT